MFANSSSSSMAQPPPPVSTNTSTSGGGLLHDFRKKTIQKIAKYTAASPSPGPSGTVPSPRASATTTPTTMTTAATSSTTTTDLTRRPGGILSPRSSKSKKEDSSATLTHRIQCFNEHDALLRQLEIQLNDMLTQIRGACVSMGRVTEVFTQTFRYDAMSYQVGVEYLATMKQMRRERAHLMDQAIRFTVVDPLASRLVRHDTLQQKITEWQQLHSELEKEDQKGPRASDGGRLLELQDQVERLEKELILTLDTATNTAAVRQLADLFTTMRLQLATFFFHTNESLISRLSETETEIVIGVGPTPRSPVAIAALEHAKKKQSQLLLSQRKADEATPATIHDPTETEPPSARGSNTTTLTASDFSESEMIDGDKVDELQRVSITLEEFEQGKCMPFSSDAAAQVMELEREAAAHAASTVPLPELLALASHPVVPTLHHDDEDDDYNSDRHARRRSRPTMTLPPSSSHHSKPHGKAANGSSSASDAASVFSSIRKSFNDKFGSPRGSEKSLFGSTPPTSPMAAATLVAKDSDTGSDEQQQQVAQHQPPKPLSDAEWASVERNLWTLDSTNNNPTEQGGRGDASTSSATSSLAELFQQPSVPYSLGEFLCPISIARLAKANRRFHDHLTRSPALWKRSIRLGGLSTTTRSAVWLSILYGGKPWRETHHEGSDHTTTTTTTTNALPHHLQSRGLRRKIYEGLLVKLGARIADGLLQFSPGEDHEDTESSQLIAWLREIDVDVARTCHHHHEIHHGSKPLRAATSTSTSTERTHLEARIRRVLRAYVMYNPRVGYCQGMNFLVRLLMQVCGGEADEADCFWLFVGLCEPENDRNLYEPGLAVLQPLFRRFESVLAAQKPLLYAHFQQEGVPVAAFCARWFLTFFSTFETFEPHVVVGILDVFVVDGWRIVFGMALVVLDALETKLMGSDMEEMLRILQAPREYMMRGQGRDNKRKDDSLRRGLAYSIAATQAT